MNEIKLTIDDKHIETVLTIINNLKDGLISKVEINGAKRPTPYKPQKNKVIFEKDSATHDKSGKYASASAYKQRLKQAKEK